jgi:hypothetical protein
MGVAVELCTGTGAVFVDGSVGVVPILVAAGAQRTRKRIAVKKSPNLGRKACLAIFISPIKM